MRVYRAPACTDFHDDLREALSLLGDEGLVRMQDQRGYRVGSVSEATCREVNPPAHLEKRVRPMLGVKFGGARDHPGRLMRWRP